MVTIDHSKNIQRIIDRIKDDDTLFDEGLTVGLLREVIFGNPNEDNKISIKQKPALYVTTKDSIQNTRYNFGYITTDNQSQVTIEYELVLVASSKIKTESSQKQLYNIIKNIHDFVNSDPLFTIPSNQPNPGTDPIFTRSVINGVKWDSKTRGKLITSVSFTLLATIGTAYTSNFPGIGDVVLLSKPNAIEGIVYSDDKEQQFPNRVLTENGDFGSIDLEYESTVALDDSFRAKFGNEEDITITTASGDVTYHVKYISINPTVSFDSIERTILHLEIIIVLRFDITSTVTFDGSFFVGGDDDAPTGMAWNNDGTKVYMIGLQNDSIHQYSVSIPFDVTSTVTLDGSFFVGGDDNLPTGMAWNDDGTKVYMVGDQNHNIYQYSVSVPYDITSTVTLDGSFSVSSQSSISRDVVWGSNGTKVYVIDLSTDTIFQYSID